MRKGSFVAAAALLGALAVVGACSRADPAHPVRAAALASAEPAPARPAATAPVVASTTTPHAPRPLAKPSVPRPAVTTSTLAPRAAAVPVNVTAVPVPPTTTAPHVTHHLVFDGQSLNVTPFTGQTYPTQLLGLVPAADLQGPVVGVAGTTYAQRSVDVATRVDALLRATDRPTILDIAGQSDLLAGLSAPDILAATETYSAGRRAAGAAAYVIFTVPPSTLYTAAQEQQRQAYNRLLRTSARFDAVVDIAALPVLADAADLRWFDDGLHPTAAGATAIAQAAYDTLVRLLGVPVRG